jgi:phage baseplate assembly protein gpV
MGVVAAGAGAAKGLVLLPDVGDQVLLLMAHEDPSWGVVIGGLYGTAGAPDAGVEEGAVRRYNLLTPGGHRLTLDDARRSIRLEASSGSYLELSPETVLLHAVHPLTLEAPGQPILVRGLSVDFQTAEEAA